MATTDSGSYKTDDVIAFLKNHLPKDFSPHLREWRIIVADAFSAHLSPQVFNLCWNRGYVLITFGGGITPVIQTCDTDLNQHVKKRYLELETAELLQQMRDGIVVPHCSPEQCIDMIAEVLMNTSLHLQAAEGYTKVGLTVPLDGSEDHMIVREAGSAWRELGMRDHVNEAIRQVRHDHKAGLLVWSYSCVKQLIVACPPRKQYDAVLKRIEQDDAGLPEHEIPYAEDDEAMTDGEEYVEQDTTDFANAGDDANNIDSNGPDDAGAAVVDQGDEQTPGLELSSKMECSEVARCDDDSANHVSLCLKRLMRINNAWRLSWMQAR